MKLRPVLWLVLFVALVTAAAGYGSRYLGPRIPKGLDLVGGVHVVLEGIDTPDNPVTDKAMQAALEVIRRRVDALGVSEPVIQRQGARRIIVDLPGSDPKRAIETIGRTALLQFVDPAGGVVVTGKDLKKVDFGFVSGTTIPAVFLEFNAEGARLFAAATERYVGQPIVIMLDEDLLQAPTVEEPIPSGKAQITGFESLERAKQIAVLLQHGSLPVKLEIIENRSVSATLGTDSLARSRTAGVIGAAAVVLFMLLFYRASGLVASLALAVYTLLVFAILAAMRATLTLPGIAGVVLSIGMAVDANVITFERIKEEIRAGKPLRSATDHGFRQALRTIVDSNVTTLIAAAVLFYYGTGPVRGFAVTLTVGILTSMFTAVVVTRFLLRQVLAANLVRSPRTYLGA